MFTHMDLSIGISVYSVSSRKCCTTQTAMVLQYTFEIIQCELLRKKKLGINENRRMHTKFKLYVFFLITNFVLQIFQQ